MQSKSLYHNSGPLQGDYRPTLIHVVPGDNSPLSAETSELK